jgi:hypothetical protein
MAAAGGAYLVPPRGRTRAEPATERRKPRTLASQDERSSDGAPRDVQRTAARRDGAEVSVSSPDGQLKRPMPRPATALPDQTAVTRPPTIGRRGLFTRVSSVTMLPAVPGTEPRLA